MNVFHLSLRGSTLSLGPEAPLLLLAGPCVIEGEEIALETAFALKKIAQEAGLPLIYKSSFDKANRTSLESFRGPGLKEGLRILQCVKEECDLPLVTDIHLPEQAAPVAEVCDLLQIPAFLCRQTDLLVAAAETGRPLFIKKGQFLAPWEMKPVVEKVRASGNTQILLGERGSCFGYNHLVTDFRSIPLMQELGVPVAFDLTHSLQLPGSKGKETGGERRFAPLLARAAIAAGADALFFETHPNPSQARCDAATQLPLAALPELLEELQQIRHALHPLTPQR